MALENLCITALAWFSFSTNRFDLPLVHTAGFKTQIKPSVLPRDT